MYFVYVLRCEDNSLYCGMTPDIAGRIKAHYFRLPRAAKYTKSHKVISLETVWECDTSTDAKRLEARFKMLIKPKKEALTENPEAVNDYIPLLSDTFYRVRKDIDLEYCINENRGTE